MSTASKFDKARERVKDNPVTTVTMRDKFIDAKQRASVNNAPHVTTSLSDYVVNEMISTGLSPAKTVIEPLLAAKERSDARSYAKISADLAAKNTEKYGTSDPLSVTVARGGEQRTKDITRLQTVYEQATADAGVYDSKAQSAKSATERALAYENAAAARKKAEEAKTELERIGGSLRSSGVANFLGKITTRDAAEPTTGFTAKTGDDGVDTFIAQMQANAAAANTANKTKDNAWSRGAMHSIGSGIAATPGLVTGALGSKSDFADRSMDFANDLAYQSSQEIEDSKEGKSKFKQGLIDLGVTGLQMATDIATGAVTGGSSLIPMAIRVFGNSGLEAYNATGDYTKAAAYGLAAAGVEVLSEKLFSSNALMKKYFGEGLLNNAGSKLYGKLMQTAAGRAAIEKLVNATGKITSTAVGKGAAFVAKNFGEEAFEEVFAGAMNPLISRIYDENALVQYSDADARAELIAETLYEGLLGGTLGLVGGAVSAPAVASAKAAKAQAEAQAQGQTQAQDTVTPPVTPQTQELQTSATLTEDAEQMSATLTEAAGVPFTNPNADAGTGIVSAEITRAPTKSGIVKSSKALDEAIISLVTTGKVSGNQIRRIAADENALETLGLKKTGGAQFREEIRAALDKYITYEPVDRTEPKLEQSDISASYASESAPIQKSGFVGWSGTKYTEAQANALARIPDAHIVQATDSTPNSLFSNRLTLSIGSDLWAELRAVGLVKNGKLIDSAYWDERIRRYKNGDVSSVEEDSPTIDAIPENELRALYSGDIINKNEQEGMLNAQRVETPIVSSQTPQTEQIVPVQMQKQQTPVKKPIDLVPSYTSDEQARIWNAEDSIASLTQEKNAINRRIAAEQDSGRIGTSMNDISRLSEIDTELKVLTDELNTIRKTAQDRTSADVDGYVPESVNAESAETTALRARLFRVEKAIEIERNPDTIKLLQDEAQRLRDEIGARHAEQSVQDASERTDEEAAAPKFGKMKESTSVPYGNPNEVQYNSLTPEEAIKSGEDYVNNRLGDANATTSEKADTLLRIENWAIEQEIASEILRRRALEEENHELARNLRDRHIFERSKAGQQLRDGYALQSPSERAEYSARNLVKDVLARAESKLEELKEKSLSDKNGKKIVKLMGQIDTLKNGLESTRKYVDEIDRAYHSGFVTDQQKNQALRSLIHEIATDRGYKYSDFTNDVLSRMDAYHLYDIALSSAVGISSDAIPTGFFERMNTWQYIAQLLNPQTIERNIIGNFAFGALENVVTGNVSAVIDHLFLSPIASYQTRIRDSETDEAKYYSDRKNMFVTAKSVGLFSKAARESAKKSAEGSIVRIQLDAPSGELGKYDTRSYQTFGGLMGSIEQILSYGMATTDAYQGAQSEGAIAASIGNLQNSNASSRVTDKIKNEMARRGSSYRTWHRQTELGTLLSSLGGALNVIGFGHNAGRTFKIRINGKTYDIPMHDFGVGDFVMKYGRFAGTAIQTAIEYTPFGIYKAIYNLSVMKATNQQIKMGENRKSNLATNNKGKQFYGFENLTNEEASVIAQREAAEAIARPIVGTTAAFAFAGLAKLGILLLTNPDDGDEAQDKRNAGLKDLQLNFSALGRLISGEDTTLRDDDLLMSVSDIAPFDTLAGVGVELANLKINDQRTVATALGAMASGAAERFADLSVMDAVQTLARDIRYRETKDAEGNDLTFDEIWKGVGKNIAADRLSSDITGFVPGPVRKLAIAFDSNSKDVSADTPLGEVWNSFRNVVPGLRNTLPEKLDAHGNPVTTGLNGVETALNSLLAPYSVTRYHASSVQELSAETGKYPSRKAPNYYTVEDEDGNKTKYELSAADKRQWMSDYGEAYDAAAELLLNSGNMDKLTPKEQAEIMGKIGSYATATAKQNYYETIGIPYTFTQNASQMDKAVKATESGIELADYFIVQKKHDEIDDNNPGSEYDKSVEFNNWLDNQDWITDTQENILRKNMQFSGGYAVGAEVGTYDELKSAGITETNSKLIYDTVAALKPPSGDDAVREWQKDEAIAKLDISDDEKLAAMQYYAAGQTKEKLAEAVDGGYSFEDIAAFRRMKSELGKKSEMEKSYEDYGLRWSVYKDLYKIFS